MPVMVSESGLDRFDVNRVLVRFGAGCDWDQSVDAAFSRVGLNQFRKTLVDRHKLGVEAMVGMCQSLPVIGLQNVDVVDCDLEIGRSLWGGENDVGGDRPRGTGDGGDGIIEVGLFVEISQGEVVGDTVDPRGRRKRHGWGYKLTHAIRRWRSSGGVPRMQR